MNLKDINKTRQKNLIPTEILPSPWALAIAKEVKSKVDYVIEMMEVKAWHPANSKAKVELERLLEKIILRAFLTDSFFKHFEVREDTKHLENVVSVIIYNEKNHIIYANDAYLEAIWVDSLEELHSLAKDGKLIQRIYSWEELVKVKDMIDRLFKDGWYINEVFKTNTWTYLMFNTIMNHDLPGWSIRVWINLNKLWGDKNYVKCQCTHPVRKAEFYDMVHDRLPLKFDKVFRMEKAKTPEELKKEQDELDKENDFLKMLDTAWLSVAPEVTEEKAEEVEEITPQSEFKRIFDESDFWKGIYLKMLELCDIASIWDILINWWPQPVFFANWDDILANNRFCELTWYQFKEIFFDLKHDGFWEKILWKDEYVKLKEDIDNLNVLEDLSRLFTITRKDGLKVDIVWNIYKYNDKGGIFWTWIVASNIRI